MTSLKVLPGSYKFLDYCVDGRIDKSDLHAVAGSRYPSTVYSFGGSLKWNAAKEETGNPEADRMLVPFERGEYSLRKTIERAGLDYEKTVHV